MSNNNPPPADDAAAAGADVVQAEFAAFQAEQDRQIAELQLGMFCFKSESKSKSKSIISHHDASIILQRKAPATTATTEEAVLVLRPLLLVRLLLGCVLRNFLPAKFNS